MKKRVFIADNTEEFCCALTSALQHSDGFQIVGTANDGELAIRMVTESKPDILVLDMMLAKKDGISVLKAISALQPRPVVLATFGFITNYMASAAASLGARYLMLKPCDMSALVERLEEIRSGEFQQQPASRHTGQTSIETMITNIIHEIGVPAHIKGYQYLREAIIIAVEDMDVINAITKVLYPRIARTYQTTPSRVERAIEHAIEVAWDRRDQNALDQFFGYAGIKRKDKPSVAEFLAVIADDIQRTMRTP